MQIKIIFIRKVLRKARFETEALGKETRWRLFILTQYPYKVQGKRNVRSTCPCVKEIVYTGFEDVIIFYQLL